MPWFSINDFHVSKGNGIVKMSEYLGISKDEIIAIGNDYNDRTMIDLAKVFVCPSNSHEDILKKSDYVYDEKEGIDKVLRKVLIENE